VNSERQGGSQAPEIDVVVPVYNKLQFLIEAVGSVVAAADAYGPAQVWLVDNGSNDGSYELLIDRFGRRARISRLIPGTIAAVRNFGARQGIAPIISFIDCDCVVPVDYFTRLASVFEESGADATGCAVTLPPSPTWVEAVWNRMHDDGANGRREWINSANFAVRRASFEKIGGFNERCETDEDTEICFRIRRVGGQLVSDRRLAAAHLDNAKTLPAFFRKERWRALGMFSTTFGGSIDKPTVMMTAHLVALVSALWVLLSGPMAVWLRILIALLLVLMVPAMTVAYRRRSSVAPFGVMPALILYELFYLARSSALAIIVARAAGMTRQRG